MKLETESKTGLWHLQHSQENQDASCWMQDPEYTAIMAADGASGCRYGRVSADTACIAAALFCAGERSAAFEYPAQKTAWLLSEEVLYELERLKLDEVIPQNFGSTLAMVLIDHTQKRALALNLGDGAIYMGKGSEGFCLIPPKTIQDQPCLTTTAQAFKYMEMEQVDVDENTWFLLATDGLLAQLTIAKKRHLLTSGNWQAIKECINQETPVDDCTFVFLDLKPGKKKSGEK